MTKIKVPALTLVIPRRAKGLEGDPGQHGMPPKYSVVPLITGLTTIYDFDAHLPLYHVPDCAEMPRLNKGSYAYLRDAGQKVVATFVMVDVDNPNHAVWESDEAIAEAYAKVKATPLGKNAGFYASRKGYRLFWSLKEPLDVIFLESLLSQLIERLAEDAIHADPACCDWTRLFRAPFATPEGSTTHIALPYDFEHGDLPWWPERLTEGKVSKRSANVSEGWAAKPPPVVPPTPEDCELLKGHPDLYKRVRKGRPLAEPGYRTNTMLKAVGIVASRLDDPQPEAIFRVLSYSVAIDRADTAQNGKPPAIEELWSVCKKIAANALTEKAEKIAFVEALRGFGGDTGSEATDTTEADKTPFSLDGLREVVLFTANDNYYVLNEESSFKAQEHLYAGPFKATSLPAMMERYAPKASPPIRSGDKRTLISTAEILTRCGAEIKQIHAYIGRKGIRYDKENKFLLEGVACIRTDLKPEYNPLIDKWLRIASGSDQERFLDWLATFCETDHPTAALYIKGEGGSGKGMLVQGLARLWGTAPTMYANIIGTHNDGLAQNPLIYADEEIPSLHYGKTTSAYFRALIGNSIHNLRRMYQPSATMHGCVRLIVTANNDNALRISEDLTPEDLQAVIDRIIYLAWQNEARDFLESIGGRATTDAWVAGDAIARHVLWLQQNRTVKRDSRWLVKGWASPFHKRLQASTGIASVVVEVVAYSISAKAGAAMLPGFVLGDGVVYAAVSGVADAWQKAMGDSNKVPSKSRILSALRQLSTAAEPQMVEVMNGVGDYDRVMMWPLRPYEIMQAMEQYQLGDTESVLRAIETSLR